MGQLFRSELRIAEQKLFFFWLTGDMAWLCAIKDSQQAAAADLEGQPATYSEVPNKHAGNVQAC